jgi:hypothetical protein
MSGGDGCHFREAGLNEAALHGRFRVPGVSSSGVNEMKR